MIPFVNIHTHHTNQVNSDIAIVDGHLIADEILPSIHAYAAGIHPCLIDELRMKEQLQHFYHRTSSNNCVAIGECGLDRLQKPPMMLQSNIFEAQITQAIALKKPVIVHFVRDFDLLIPLLKTYPNQIPFIIYVFISNQNIETQFMQHATFLTIFSKVLNTKNEKL